MLTRAIWSGLLFVACAVVAPAAQAEDDPLRICQGDTDIDPEDSVAACTALIPQDDRAAEGMFYYFRGVAYQRLHEHRKAIADYGAAIERIPDRPDLTSLFLLARAEEYYDLGDREAAIEDFRRVLDLDPPNDDMVDEAHDRLSSLHADP